MVQAKGIEPLILKREPILQTGVLPLGPRLRGGSWRSLTPTPKGPPGSNRFAVRQRQLPKLMPLSASLWIGQLLPAEQEGRGIMCYYLDPDTAQRTTRGRYGGR